MTSPPGGRAGVKEELGKKKLPCQNYKLTRQWHYKFTHSSQVLATRFPKAAYSFDCHVPDVSWAVSLVKVRKTPQIACSSVLSSEHKGLPDNKNSIHKNDSYSVNQYFKRE